MFWSEQKNNTPQILPRLPSPETHNLIGRSWLDKLLKSKVDWFMAPIGWLPVPVAYHDCSPVAQKDRGSGSIGQSFNQSDPHRRQGSTVRTLIGCSLIIFEMITVAVRRPTLKVCTCTLHTQHISLPFPLSIYAQRRAGGRVGFFVCRSICLTHVTALIYAGDERTGGNGRFPARWCVWEKRYISFQGGDQWHEMLKSFCDQHHAASLIWILQGLLFEL